MHCVNAKVRRVYVIGSNLSRDITWHPFMLPLSRDSLGVLVAICKIMSFGRSGHSDIRPPTSVSRVGKSTSTNQVCREVTCTKTAQMMPSF
jgi:hypothetical protein